MLRENMSFVFLPCIISALIFSITSIIISFIPNTTNSLLLGATSGLIELIVNILIEVMFFTTISLSIKKLLQQENVSLKDNFNEAVMYYGKAVRTWGLFSVMSLLLSILLIIPGIIYGVPRSLCLYAVLYRNKSTFDAFDYSRKLVQGKWWMVFGANILPVIVSFIVSGLIGAVIGYISGRSGFDLSLVNGFMFNFILMICMAFIAMVETVMFFNFENNLKQTQSPGQELSC